MIHKRDAFSAGCIRRHVAEGRKGRTAVPTGPWAMEERGESGERRGLRNWQLTPTPPTPFNFFSVNLNAFCHSELCHPKEMPNSATVLKIIF